MIDLLLNLPVTAPQPGQGRTPGDSSAADFAALLGQRPSPDGTAPFPHERELPIAQTVATTTVRDESANPERPAIPVAVAASNPSMERVIPGTTDVPPPQDLGPRPQLVPGTPASVVDVLPLDRPAVAQHLQPRNTDPARPQLQPPAPVVEAPVVVHEPPLPMPPLRNPRPQVDIPPVTRPPLDTPSIPFPQTLPPPIGQPRPEVPQVRYPLQLHLPIERPQTGTTAARLDWLSLPWRLQANAGLSYRTAALPLVRADRIAAQAVAATIPPAQTRPGSVPTFPNAAPRTWERIDGLLERFAQTEWPAPGSDHDWCGTSGGPVRRGLVAWLIWPQRLLRWHPDPTGEGGTAWVRDFTLDPAQAQPLVDSILALAEEQGISLHRIVLNGHEVWSSDSSNA
jgi:hypothetical protein